jgi:hypothetical protein
VTDGRKKARTLALAEQLPDHSWGHCASRRAAPAERLNISTEAGSAMGLQLATKTSARTVAIEPQPRHSKDTERCPLDFHRLRGSPGQHVGPRA